MIHDAQVEVTCDSGDCNESVYVDLHYVYHSYSGKRGQYDHSDVAIENALRNEHDWIVKDGKHYCSYECANEMAE